MKGTEKMVIWKQIQVDIWIIGFLKKICVALAPRMNAIVAKEIFFSLESQSLIGPFQVVSLHFFGGL